MATAGEFYRGLYRLIDRERLVAVCNHPKQGTAWRPVHELMNCTVREKAVENRQYFSIGLFNKRPLTGRGKKENVVEVPALWCDLDYSDKHCKRSGKQYPTEKHAWQALGELKSPPSAVIYTGGGIHCYWFLDEAGIARSCEEVEIECAGLQRSMIAKLKAIDPAYSMDTTHDCTRILRIPGTVNTKYGIVVDVVTLRDVRYPLSGEWDDAPNPKIAIIDHAGEVDLGQEVDPGRLIRMTLALCENSRDFKQVWEHTRKMSSSSEYEMSIAHHAVACGWPDAYVAALIMMHRKEWEPSKIDKASRPDYLRKTIGTAKQFHGGTTSLADVEGQVDIEEVPAEEKKALVFKSFSSVIGINVSRILQVGTEATSSRLTLVDVLGNRIELGTVKAAMSHAHIRTVIFTAFGVILERLKDNRWQSILAATHPYWEIDNHEMTTHEAIGELLREYAYEFTTTEVVSFADVKAGKPIEKSGFILVNVSNFMSYLSRRRSRFTQAEVQAAFRLAGMSPRNITAKKGEGVQAGRSYWSTGLPALSEKRPVRDSEDDPPS